MDPDVRLMSYVDGELDASARAAFEQELAADPALQAEVARQRRLRARLSAAFDGAINEPVPLRLALAAQTANAPRAVWRAPQWAAMAACLLAGVLVGRAALSPSGAITERNGGLLVQGRVAQALDTRLTAEPGPIRIGLTFRNADGRWCRTFESDPDHLAGLACREPQGWSARALTPWSPRPEAAYRTAGTETPAPILAAVDAAINGTPVDANGERAARARRWKP